MKLEADQDMVLIESLEILLPFAYNLVVLSGCYGPDQKYFPRESDKFLVVQS